MAPTVTLRTDHGIIFLSHSPFPVSLLLLVWLGVCLISHRVVVVEIHLRFSSSSFSSRSTTPPHQHHQHSAITMHHPSHTSSDPSLSRRPSRAVHSLQSAVSIRCAFGKSSLHSLTCSPSLTIPRRLIRCSNTSRIPTRVGRQQRVARCFNDRRL